MNLNVPHLTKCGLVNVFFLSGNTSGQSMRVSAALQSEVGREQETLDITTFFAVIELKMQRSLTKNWRRFDF